MTTFSNSLKVIRYSAECLILNSFLGVWKWLWSNMVSYVWLYWLTVSWTSLDSETGRNKNKTSWVIAKRFSIFEVRFTTFDSVEGSYYKGPRLNVEKVLTSVMLRSAQNFAFRVLTGTGNDYEPRAVTCKVIRVTEMGLPQLYQNMSIVFETPRRNNLSIHWSSQ